MIALSIRQPWAWLIFHAGKDIENRQWPTRFRGRFLIHASKGMTRVEYQVAREFAEERGFPGDVPGIDELDRGGIVGEATLVDCVERSASPWFCGDYGFVLRDARPLPFRPCRGALGFFRAALNTHSKAPESMHDGGDVHSAALERGE